MKVVNSISPILNCLEIEDDPSIRLFSIKLLKYVGGGIDTMAIVGCIVGKEEGKDVGWEDGWEVGFVLGW